MIDTLSAARLTPAKREPIPGVIGRAIIDVVRAWRIANAERRIALQLNALNDHVLRDIGVSRVMVNAVASELAKTTHPDRQA